MEDATGQYRVRARAAETKVGNAAQAARAFKIFTVGQCKTRFSYPRSCLTQRCFR